MTFLKKLGSILATITGIFTGFAPVLRQEFPQTGTVIDKFSTDLSAIGDAVVNAEALGQLQGLSGADKAKAVAPLVAQIILNGSLVAGKKIANQALFLQGSQEIGGGVADILNSLHEDNVNGVVTKVNT